MSYKIRPCETDGSCLECGVEFRGRRDKKFCSLACKNNYNNRKIKAIRQYRADIIAKLSRNYEILEMLLGEKVTRAGLEEIEKIGFDAAYVTGSSRGQGRSEECRCFDIAYRRTGSRIFNLRRMEIPTRYSPVPFQAPNSRR